MADREWGPSRPEGGDEWVRPVGPGRPGRPPEPAWRDVSDPSGERRRRPGPGPDDPVYSGPQFPREMVGYAARRDPTDPRGVRSGVRLAKPASKWELADGLPTVPTMLVAGAAVLLAFLIGRATGGGGGSSSVAATSQTSATVVATTTTIPATHTVVVGDSLSSIAASFGLTTQDLASYNNISNLNHVFTGEVIKIPPSATPTTVPGTPTTKK